MRILILTIGSRGNVQPYVAFGATLRARALRCIPVPSFLQPAYVPTRAFPNLIFPFAEFGPFGKRLSHALALRIMRPATVAALHVEPGVVAG